MAEESPTKKEGKKSIGDETKEGKKGKKEDDETVKVKADERTKRIIDTLGEMFRSRSERIKKKKEAAKSAGRIQFGGGLLLSGVFLALAGSVALPFWGMKKILEKEKSFMAGFNLFK